jgi:TDG/mug DNA glycosylase family protein
MLRDRVRPPVRVLLVGINPGVRSAAIGHHFAGPSNRFWKLLYESGLVPERLGPEDDHRLPEFGFGVTNLIPRSTPGIDTLTRQEYVDGVRALRRKVRRWKPEIVALVGVTLYRVLAQDSRGEPDARRSRRSVPAPAAPTPNRAAPIACGFQPERVEGARMYVLPNPSGRNAHYSYQQMLDAFQGLAAAMADVNRGRSAPAILR